MRSCADARRTIAFGERWVQPGDLLREGNRLQVEAVARVDLGNQQEVLGGLRVLASHLMMAGDLRKQPRVPRPQFEGFEKLL